MTEREEVTVTLMPSTIEQIEEIRDVIAEQPHASGRGSKGMVIDLAVKEFHNEAVRKREVWD